jgi:hypothetical protein
MSTPLTTALNALLNTASPELKSCLTDDLNTHLRAIRTLGNRTILTNADVHNLFMRWAITSQAVTPPAPASENLADEVVRENLMTRFENELAQEALNRPRAPHPALGDAQS